MPAKVRDNEEALTTDFQKAHLRQNVMNKNDMLEEQESSMEPSALSFHSALKDSGTLSPRACPTLPV